MTTYQEVFKSFLSKIQKDSDFSLYTDQELEEDMMAIMDSAIASFKFPREDLNDRDDHQEIFTNTIKKDTINVLTNYMYYYWKLRKGANTDTLHQRVTDSSLVFFSQSNHGLMLDKSIEMALKLAERSEDTYYRSVSGRPSIAGLVGEEI